MCVLKVKNSDLIKFDNTALIKGVSLEINGGDVVLLTGKNGTGKTTLLNALVNNYGINGMAYARFVDDFEIGGKMTDTKLYDRVIYVPQNDYISFSFYSVYKALLEACPFPGGEGKNYVNSWLEKYEPFSVEDKKKNILKKRIGKLSGGERKYVALIQLLLRSDIDGIKLIIMDEPITSLDQNHVRLLSNLLLKIRNSNPQIGFLIVSHCHAFPYVTSVIEIKDGTLNKGKYCFGECFGTPNNEGFYLL